MNKWHWGSIISNIFLQEEYFGVQEWFLEYVIIDKKLDKHNNDEFHDNCSACARLSKKGDCLVLKTDRKKSLMPWNETFCIKRKFFSSLINLHSEPKKCSCGFKSSALLETQKTLCTTYPHLCKLLFDWQRSTGKLINLNVTMFYLGHTPPINLLILGGSALMKSNFKAFQAVLLK